MNQYIAKDEMAVALGYYAGDYTSIATADLGAARNSNTFDIAAPVGSAYTNNNLYNGNISYMATALPELERQQSGEPLIQTMAYKYDQLNRLIYSRSYRDYNVGSGNWSRGGNNYDLNVGYDKNGNITNLTRIGNNGLMDNLTYQYDYTTSGNKLKKSKRCHSIRSLYHRYRQSNSNRRQLPL